MTFAMVANQDRLTERNTGDCVVGRFECRGGLGFAGLCPLSAFIQFLF
jgi:hypothetical protein